MAVPALRQELSAIQLFTLGFGCIIGVGWIILVGEWLANAGSLGTVIAFVIGGCGMALIGLCYCEAATRFPVAGGEVAYCYGYFGLRSAFVAGWIVVLTLAVGTAFEAISVGWILALIFPDISGPVLYFAWGEPVHAGRLLAGLVGMGLIAAINWLGIRETARLQDLITYGLIGLTLACVLVAFWAGDWANLQPLLAEPPRSAVTGTLSVLAMIPLFYLGFNVIPQAIEEKGESVGSWQVTAAIVLAILAAMVFYVLVVLMTAVAIPRDQLLGRELPAYAAISAVLGSAAAGKAVLVAGLLGLASSWNAIFFAGTRVLLVLARIGTIPEAFAQIHPVRGTPGVAIVLVAIVGSLGSLLGPAALGPMVNGLGTAMTLVFAMIAYGILATPAAGTSAARLLGPRLVKIVPTVAGLIAVGLGIVGLTQAYLGRKMFPPLEWLLLILWAALGLFFWLIVTARRRAMSDEARRRILFPQRSDPIGTS